MLRIAPLPILAGALLTLVACNSTKKPPELPRSEDASFGVPARGVQALAKERTNASSDRNSLPVIVCFGDSLTAGYGADEGASYPDFLQKDLDREGFHYRVINEGVSGNTTKDGVDRLPLIVSLKPRIVVLEFGGNDGLRGLRVQATRTNLASMIKTLQSSGARVALAGITLPPDYGGDYVTNFTSTYPLLGTEYHVPILPFLLEGVFGVQGMMQQDRIHATNEGNEVVAQNVLHLIKPLLKR